MSLGSRLAKRGRAAVNASHVSIPREPLTFLYPAWIRNSSTSSPSPSSATAVAAPEGFVQLLSTPVDNSELPIPIKEGSIILDAIDQLAGTAQHKEEALDAQEHSVGSDPVVWRPISTEGSDTSEQQVNATKQFTTARRVVQRKSEVILGGEKLRDVRLAYQTERRLRNGLADWVPDWRVILADLSQNTPHHEKWLEKAVTIQVPKDSATELLFGVDNNIWNIADKNGTIIEVGAKSPDGGLDQSFMISGSKTTITRTATDILRVAPDAQVKLGVGMEGAIDSRSTTSSSAVNADGVEIGGRDGLARYSRPRPVIKAQVAKAGKMFSVPAKWTQESFLDHVTALTTIKVPHQLQQLMYKNDMRHIDQVHKLLQEIFHDPEREPVVSRTAFHEALKFCIRTNQLPALRKLIFRMEVLEISKDTETFNIMLRGCAMNEDLHNFHFILHLMLRQGISPNTETWVAFLLAVRDLRIKLHILNRMKEFDLTRRIKTVKNIVKGLVNDEVDASLDNGQTQEAFLTHMDTRYGRSWLTTTAGNRVLHSLALRGMISRCWDFLLVMSSREQCMPDAISINTILNHLKQEKDIYGAIQLLRDIPPSWGIVLDEATYHIIFEMAWRGRRYNLAKVVWKYACMAGRVSWRMKNRVFTSIENNSKRWWNESTEKISPRTVWDETAGQFLVRREVTGHPILIFERELMEKYGLDALKDQLQSVQSVWDETHVPGLPTTEAEPPHGSSVNPVLSPRSFLDGGKLSFGGSETPKSSKLMHDCFALDQKLLHYFVPVEPFADMLSKAWEKDQKWKQLSNEKKWTWKKIDHRQRRITVPVQSCVPHLELMTKAEVVMEDGTLQHVSKPRIFSL